MKRVFMLTDIEGVAGVVSFEDQACPGGRDADNAKRLLTAEVNAATEALLAAGVDDVLVCDGHGSGGIWFEDLHPAARLLHGRPITVAQLFSTLESHDAAIIIGQHAMAGVPSSNMNHTQNSRTVDYFQLNGQRIGEIAQFALYAGTYGIPVIFLSGERDACIEIESLIPEVVTACVKEGLGRGAAISLSAPASRQRIREGVARAIEQHRAHPVAPLIRSGPFVLEKRFFTTDLADREAAAPDAERVDGQTVRYRSDDLRTVLYR